jgi:hypothetical protein
MSQTSSEFVARSTTRKGAVGERVLSRVASTFFPGAISFVPLEEDGAHQCDRILVHWRDKRIILVDAKAKPARSFYPDTGIDEHSFNTYREMARRHRALVLLCFIDEGSGLCYGNLLGVLAKPRQIYWQGHNLTYPLSQLGRTGRIVLFPLEYMRQLAMLLPEEIAELTSLSTRSDYAPSQAVNGRLGLALAPNSWLPSQRALQEAL